MIKKYDKHMRYFIVSVVFIISFVFMWNRSKYGYIYNDEPFILTLAHRLVKNDIFLWDEWQPAQLSGYLNYPLLKIFFFSNDNTEGIILTFRHVYIILWFTVIFYLFYKYSKISKYIYVTCGASLYLFFFSSLDILTVSYNFYSLSGILISYAIVSTSSKKIYLIISGIFFSIATLACPYLAIIFIIYYVVLLLLNLYRNIHRKCNLIQNINYKSLYFLYGVLISVILFLIFFFLHGGSIDKAIKTLPIILNDSEYPSRSLIQLVVGYLLDFIKSFKVFILAFLVCFGMSFIDKKRKELYFKIHCFLFCVDMILLITWYKYALNFSVVPICFLGLHALLSNFKECNKNYLVLYFIGALLSFVLYATSDCREMAIAMGLSVSGFSSFLLIYQYIETFNSINFTSKKIIILAILSSQLLVQVHFRLERYYHNRKLSENIYELKTGPAKGLYVNEEKREYYETIIEDYAGNIPRQSKVLVFSMNPWLYLFNDGEYCTYSSWMVGTTDYRISQLKIYFEIHPEKLPDYVYIKKEDYSDSIKNSLFSDYAVKETEIAYILIKE